jgi:hypothetical protein
MNLGTSGAWQAKLSDWDTFGFYIYHTTNGFYIPPQSTGTFGWDELMVNGADHGDGHKEADGEWHYMEIHVKYESSLGVPDGEAEMWVDGNLIVSDSSVEFGSTSGALGFQAPNNQDSPGVTSEMTLDHDDYALSTTGYIGPLGGGGGDTSSPTVNITNPALGQTLSGAVIIGANAQDDVAIAHVQFQIDGQILDLQYLKPHFSSISIP